MPTHNQIKGRILNQFGLQQSDPIPTLYQTRREKIPIWVATSLHGDLTWKGINKSIWIAALALHGNMSRCICSSRDFINQNARSEQECRRSGRLKLFHRGSPPQTELIPSQHVQFHQQLSLVPQTRRINFRLWRVNIDCPRSAAVTTSSTSGE